MEYQVSARKYRPGTFDDVIGQPHVVQTLVNSIITKRIAQAYLFSGTRGVGKTTVARILAKALNCERGPTGTPCGTCSNCLEIAQGTSVDVMEIDGASNTSVDDVREIRENVKFAAFRGKYRVYIIDEVHMLSNSAFNALLKTLEEPPPHVVFIFATTEIHKIPATILSRCQHYNFRRIARTEIVERLRHVVDQDKDRDRGTEPDGARQGQRRQHARWVEPARPGGSVRRQDDRACGSGGPAGSGSTRTRSCHDSGDYGSGECRGASRAGPTVGSKGMICRAYCAEVVEYLRNMLVMSVVTSPQEWQGLIEAPAEDLAQMAANARSFSPEPLQELFAIFTQAEDSLRLSAHPRFVLETAAVRATRLLSRADGKSPQSVQLDQTTRPPQSAPVRTGQPVSPARSTDPLRSSRHRDLPQPDGSYTGRSDAVEAYCCREYSASTRPPRRILRTSGPLALPVR